jgi:hypothetical protein
MSRKKTTPSFDWLEAKTLLSGLSESLKTDHAAYQAGQPVQMTFTETNASSQPIVVSIGPSLDGFEVMQNGQLVWRSNVGGNPNDLKDVTLKPGQSLTLTATWSGVPNAGNLSTTSVDTGTFVVFNELDPKGATATFQIADFTPVPPPILPGPAPPTSPPTTTSPPPSQPTAPSPPDSQPSAPGPINSQPSDAGASGATSSSTASGSIPSSVGDPVVNPSPITVAVTTDHPVYRRGQPVHIRLAVTDNGHGATSLASDPTADGFRVYRGSTLVWRSRPGLRARTLQPGKSIHLTAVWNGRPNQPGVNRLGPGTYTIQAEEGGFSGSTTITVGRARS